MKKIFYLLMIVMIWSSCKEDKIEFPVFEDQTFSVDENSKAGIVVGTVIISDRKGGNFEFSVVGGNEDGFFELDKLTGVITIANGSNIDFELKSEYIIGIEIIDKNSNISSSAKITIYVNNLVMVIGPTAWYDFNDNYNDKSGNNFIPVNSGTNFTFDRYNNPNAALEFNGTDEYLTLPSTFDFENRTISMWFYAESMPIYDPLYPSTSWTSLLTCDYPGLNNGSLNLCLSKVGDAYKVWFYEGGMDTKANPDLFSAEIQRNEWNNVIISLSPQEVKFYVNGNLINSHQSAFLNSVNGNPNMMIGTTRLPIGKFFDGRLDNLLIYDRILSADEIALVSKE